MRSRKKGPQCRDIGLTIQTIHRGPLVARHPLRLQRGAEDDKKREQPLREDRGGERDVVYGGIPDQLVLRVLQPVYQFGVTGRPIVRGHRVSFRCDLGMSHRTRSAWHLASARRGTRGAGAGRTRVVAAAAAGTNPLGEERP